MLRFVVLRHELPPGHARASHWDFMLEWEETLRTWALEEAPDREEAITAEPLPDHRTEYLTYEGEVSSGRGRVSRWDHGTYRVVRESPMEIALRLTGEKLKGDATLTRTEDRSQRWVFTFSKI